MSTLLPERKCLEFSVLYQHISQDVSWQKKIQFENLLKAQIRIWIYFKLILIIEEVKEG